MGLRHMRSLAASTAASRKAAAFTRKRQFPEFALHCQIMDFLRVALPSHAIAFHPANGEARTAQAGARLKRMGVVRGISDIVIIVKQQSANVLYGSDVICLEVKAIGGIESDAQIDAAGKLEMAGCYCKTVRSVEDVQRALDYRGVPLRCRLS